jgi:ubiquinone/menaquinone biosynthesis C-methylase UbiE
MKKENISRVVKVYGNINQHRSVADLIRKRSTNKRDVRDVALENIHLQSMLNILDLGCGFGFFTEALEGKIAGRASITGVDLIPGHEPLFLQACAQAGVRCRFIPGNVSVITSFADRSFDLVLCSYALYFFPEMVPHIARILKPGGIFTTITHDSQNMGELFDCIKNIMDRHYAQKEHLLPAERIIRKFSAENGGAILARWFKQVKTIDYPNALVYHMDDLQEIIDYFHFKSPFFLAGTKIDEKDIAIHLPDLLKQKSHSANGVVISKNDRIFICSEPRPNEVEP